MKITLKEAQRIARKHGMSIRNTEYGYRVNFRNEPESHAAYEATIQGALDTARVMYENRKRGLKHYWVV